MEDNELLRYSRHILLDEIGIEGQQSLLDAHAVIVGAGGLGSPAALYLAASGVGHITLIDHDQVDLTNLQRQIGHTTDRVGLPKVDSLAQAMQAINPLIRIDCRAERATPELLAELLASASVVLDCCDNYRTRQAVNQACVEHHVPLVAGAAIRLDGQITVIDPRQPEAPCYACLFPPDAEFEEVQCSRMGVLAPLVGLIGAMQAVEAVKLLIGIGESLAGRLLMLDGRSMHWSSIHTRRNPDCPVCCKGK